MRISVGIAITCNISRLRIIKNGMKNYLVSVGSASSGI